MDGGLIANNPTLDALTEIHEYNLALKAMGREKEIIPVTVVVSLGTGQIPVKSLNDIDIFWPNLLGSVKVVYGMSTLSSLLVDQVISFQLAMFGLVFKAFFRLQLRMEGSWIELEPGVP